MALNKVVDIDSLSIKSVGSFYDGSNDVERDEFNTFVTPLIKNNSSMTTMLWIPCVNNQQRTAFENSARSNVWPNFTITEEMNDKLVPSTSRNNHYPIFFAESSQPITNLIGFDLGLDSGLHEGHAIGLRFRHICGHSTDSTAWRRQTSSGSGILTNLSAYTRGNPTPRLKIDAKIYKDLSRER